ncbi:sodium-driven chloride bicarbonate exchanger-like isoform X4 [Haliotis cracherodii]|uniref:sodium-driven chloride bicarbonate exchanger-like isoform X4 n=1 Tax=Haliotis cracherodii TaxID=6455 RepID=UPI0039ECB2C4
MSQAPVRLSGEQIDGSMPVRDWGSFVRSHAPSDAELSDHRKQGSVYIGLQLPRRRHRRRHHKHHKREPGDQRVPKDDITDEPDVENDITKSATPPAQRVQYILGEEEEDEEHRAHDLFCEMAELFFHGDEMEWKETARWVKFEEDVEEGGERWSKPHVATLSLHSLFELRCCIMTGTIILDMDAVNIEQVTDIILDNMIASKQLEETLKDQVRDVILCRHHHQNEKRHRRDDNSSSKIHLPIIRSLADIGKKYSEPKGLAHQGGEPLSGDQRNPVDDRIGAKSTPNMLRVASNASGGETTEGGNNLPSNNSFVHSHHADIPENASHKNLHFMKKIPPGAEASNILVGEVDFLNHQIVGFVRLSKAVLLGDLTEVPVPTRFLFVLLGPTGNQNKFHELGRSIATLMSDEIFHDVAYHARNKEDLLAGIDEFLDQVTVLPPGEWDPSIRIEPPTNVPSQEGRKTASAGPPQPNGKVIIEEEDDEHNDPTLQRTGRIFGGLVDDIRRKLPYWSSDFHDALSVQCIASFIFLYFACLTPIITFGGLLGDATDNNMAALESILAGAICGIVYSLFAGQPLTILGSTGPVLVFETILNHFCHENDLDYLQLRLWIGLWTGIILIIMVAFDLSALVRYITRFTEESFAALISLIFIIEAFKKLFHILDHDPVNLRPDEPLIYTCYCVPENTTVNSTIAWWFNRSTPTVYLDVNQTMLLNWDTLTKDNCSSYNGTMQGPGCDTPHFVADVFLFSLLLFLGTFTIAMVLKMSRNSSFFPTMVRSVVSDFAVLIAIVAMLVVDIVVGLDTPKLDVPETFAPTNPKRNWVVSPIGRNPWWTAIAAVIPALLATILIFMDQQITAVIVNRKENKLVKGHGYHLDLLLVACLIIVNSFMGLPWFVAATVLSINHVNSLKKESQCSAPGEKPKFLGVREQRVTGVMIFLMIGLSVLLTSILKYIPMAVLYGVFLYMGVSSLRGMELVDRVMILFMPAKYQTDLMYLRHVRIGRVHLFTAIQILCLSILWVIKTIKKISIAFPIMVLAMCFVRKAMDYLFTQRELKWLDDIMPESHKRAQEDEEKQKNEERLSIVDGMDGGMTGNNFTMAISADPHLDSVNISEEMAKTALWKTIVANDSSSNLISDMEHRSSSKKYVKKKKHGKKKHSEKDPESLPTIPGSPQAVSEEDEEEEEHTRSPTKKKGHPVKFYIDDDGPEEKESLIKPPQIVVDPPSDIGNMSSPDNEDTKV